MKNQWIGDYPKFPIFPELEGICDKDAPYPGAKPHYVVEESQLSDLENLPDILFAISKSLPAKKKKVKRTGIPGR